MGSAKPFRLNVPEEEIQKLHQRLRDAIYPDQLGNITPWEDGTDLTYFKVRGWVWLPPAVQQQLKTARNSKQMPSCVNQLLAKGIVHAQVDAGWQTQSASCTCLFLNPSLRCARRPPACVLPASRSLSATG